MRTETLHLFVIPSPAPHPIQANRQSPRHRYVRDFAAAALRQVEKLVAPPAIAAHGRLRRFHQPAPQQAVPRLADRAPPPSFPAGFFFWNQTQIGCDLLAAVEPLGFPEAQHKRPLLSEHLLLGVSSSLEPRNISPPPPRSPASTRPSSGGCDPTPAADLPAGDLPREPAIMTPIAGVRTPARVGSCNVRLHGSLPRFRPIVSSCDRSLESFGEI